MSKKWLIVLLCIIIPLVVGVVVFFGFKLGWFGTKASQAPAVKEYPYTIGEFLVNLDEPGYKRYMKVSIVVGSDSKKLGEELTEKTPKVKDTIISILRSKKIEDVNTPQKTDTVKKEIKDKLNTFLDTGKVTSIYLENLLIQ